MSTCKKLSAQKSMVILFPNNNGTSTFLGCKLSTHTPYFRTARMLESHCMMHTYQKLNYDHRIEVEHNYWVLWGITLNWMAKSWVLRSSEYALLNIINLLISWSFWPHFSGVRIDVRIQCFARRTYHRVLTFDNLHVFMHKFHSNWIFFIHTKIIN